MVKEHIPHPDVTVYDDYFSMENRKTIFEYMKSMPYSIAQDSAKISESYISSIVYNYNYADKCGKLAKSLKDIIETSEGIQNDEIVYMQGNIFTYADSHSIQTFSGVHTSIYFANDDSKSYDGVNIYLYDRSGKSIVCTIPCAPGKMVIIKDGAPFKLGKISAPTSILFALYATFNKKTTSVKEHNNQWNWS